MPILKAFNNVKRKPLPAPSGVAGMDDLRSVAALEVGVGNRAFKADQSGLWLGANAWADAPFRVGMDGSIYIESDDGKLVIDATNNRIVIYDSGGVPKVLIGYHENGF